MRYHSHRYNTTEMSTGAGVAFSALVIFLLAAIFFIIFTDGGAKLGNRNDTARSYDGSSGSSESAGSGGWQMQVGDGVFNGNGFTLEYPPNLWLVGEAVNQNGVIVPCLQHAPSGTLLGQSGASGLPRLALRREEDRENYAENIHYLLSASVKNDAGSYVEQETASFEELYKNVYYAAYAIYSANGAMSECMYIVASVEDGLVLSLIAQLPETSSTFAITDVYPLLRTMRFTAVEAPEPPERGEVVRYTHDAVEINGTAMPTLDKIMSDQQISYEKTGPEKISGSMPVPNMSGCFSEPELALIEISETTYTDIEIEEIWDVIEEYGDLLSYEYDFYTSHRPQAYPAYGEGYCYYELISWQEEGYSFAAFIYNPLSRTIHLQMGMYWTHSTSSGGIGPVNLDKIGRGL